MSDNFRQSTTTDSDMNNNQINKTKKRKRSHNIGQIKELHMLNFMCHKNFSIQFHPTHMQIITGANGSGKSTIANAVSLCLGAQARTTGRTSNVQSFIRKGETYAQLTVILANEGPEAYKPELYGREIEIIRRIGIRKSSYKIRGTNHKTISKRKETVDEITQALSISPENPLCILHQEIAKTFLITSDPRRKYHFYMKVSQLEQIKQAYEQGICTIESLTQRVNTMRQKHVDMLRELEPLEQDVKKIELRRDYEEKKHRLGAELLIARSDQARQELLEFQNQFELLQSSKNDLDDEIHRENNELVQLDQRLEEYSQGKIDIQKDQNALGELSNHFLKEKHDIQKQLNSRSLELENYRQLLAEIKLEQVYIQKQIDKYEHVDRQSTRSMDDEISVLKEKENEYERLLTSLNEDIHVNDQRIREKESTMNILEKEYRQKQEDLKQLIQIDQDKTNVFADWISKCLKTIENESRFHEKPIGPISRYIHCLDPHWSYAVEKHLDSIMSFFICCDHDDERLLIEIFSLFSLDHRPPIYIRRYSEHVHDISGTVQCIRQANLRTIYDVLKIENSTVECVLIDAKHIETTLLVENLAEMKKLRTSGLLNWKKIDRKVRSITEAWTSDGVNIKLDNTFRIYTNEKQPMKYFLSNHITQSLSINELTSEVNSFVDQLEQIKQTLNQLKTIRQTTFDEIHQTRIICENNREKFNELMKEYERWNSIMPMNLDCPLEELQIKAQRSREFHTEALRQFDEAKEKHREYLFLLADTTDNHENILRKLDEKTQEYEQLVEKVHDEQSIRAKRLVQMKKSTNKIEQLNNDLIECQKKIDQLAKKCTKKSKKSMGNLRSIREIEHELDAINRYLQTHQDTNEIRREIIEQYRSKRDVVRQYKQTYERCYQQIERLREFVYKRQEGFQIIADQHRYILRLKFQDFMRKYHFDESDIQIDHKKEELHLIIKRGQRNLASLSGGERSISTFCFLSALWETIYQPFRLLDEIDIYMDNEKLNSTLNILYENTVHHSNSQHIIFTPQMIDSQRWNDLNVPMFQMSTPKHVHQSSSNLSFVNED